MFVDTHCKNLSGLLKIRACEQNHESSDATYIHVASGRKSSSESRKNDTSNHSTDADIIGEANPEENWKNKNKKPSDFRRSKTSILNPHDVNYHYSSVPLFKNAYTCSRKIDKNVVDLRSTCAFDSTLCVYSAAFLDNFNLHQIIDSSEDDNRFSSFIKKIFEHRLSMKALHVQKTDILHDFYAQFYEHQISTTENTMTLDCFTSYGPFLKQFLKEMDADHNHARQ